MELHLECRHNEACLHLFLFYNCNAFRAIPEICLVKYIIGIIIIAPIRAHLFSFLLLKTVEMVVLVCELQDRMDGWMDDVDRLSIGFNSSYDLHLFNVFQRTHYFCEQYIIRHYFFQNCIMQLSFIRKI